MTFSQLGVLKTKLEQAFYINFTQLVQKCKQFIVQMPFNLCEILHEACFWTNFFKAKENYSV